MSISKQESHNLPKKRSFVDKLKNTIESSSSIIHELHKLISLSACSQDPILALSHDEFISQTPEELSLLYKQQCERAQQLEEIAVKANTLLQEKTTSTVDTNVRFFSTLNQEINTDIPLDMIKQFLLTNDTKKILLLVDDTISQLKILAHAIKNKMGHRDTTTNILHEIINEQWIIKQVQMELFNDWVIIYAANGDIALEIINLGYPINTLITDQNMPQKKLQGIDLIREVVKTHSLNIALHTSDPITQFNEEERAVIEQNNVTFIGKGKVAQINEFITKILDKMTDDNTEKPQVR